MPHKVPKAVTDAIQDVAQYESTDPTAPDDGTPMPPTAKRGTARSKVLQVRLNDDELTALERIAAQRGLPVSTIARESLLDLIAGEDGAPTVARLRATVARLNSLVGEVDSEFSSTLAQVGTSAEHVADVAERLGLERIHQKS